MKHSLYHLILWLAVAITIAIIFLSKGTIDTWGDSSLKKIIIFAVFFFGYLIDIILKFIFRKRKNKIIKDERDDYVMLKSSSTGYIITSVYIFILSISLYIKYESTGSVPVAWLWFIAYSLFIVANIVSSILSLIYYRKSS